MLNIKLTDAAIWGVAELEQENENTDTNTNNTLIQFPKKTTQPNTPIPYFRAVEKHRIFDLNAGEYVDSILLANGINDQPGYHYIDAPTGAGKSRWMANFIMALVRAGKKVVATTAVKAIIHQLGIEFPEIIDHVVQLEHLKQNESLNPDDHPVMIFDEYQVLTDAAGYRSDPVNNAIKVIENTVRYQPCYFISGTQRLDSVIWEPTSTTVFRKDLNRVLNVYYIESSCSEYAGTKGEKHKNDDGKVIASGNSNANTMGVRIAGVIWDLIKKQPERVNLVFNNNGDVNESVMQKLLALNPELTVIVLDAHNTALMKNGKPVSAKHRAVFEHITEKQLICGCGYSVILSTKCLSEGINIHQPLTDDGKKSWNIICTQARPELLFQSYGRDRDGSAEYFAICGSGGAGFDTCEFKDRNCVISLSVQGERYFDWKQKPTDDPTVKSRFMKIENNTARDTARSYALFDENCLKLKFGPSVISQMCAIGGNEPVFRGYSLGTETAIDDINTVESKHIVRADLLTAMKLGVDGVKSQGRIYLDNVQIKRGGKNTGIKRYSESMVISTVADLMNKKAMFDQACEAGLFRAGMYTAYQLYTRACSATWPVLEMIVDRDDLLETINTEIEECRKLIQLIREKGINISMEKVSELAGNFWETITGDCVDWMDANQKYRISLFCMLIGFEYDEERRVWILPTVEIDQWFNVPLSSAERHRYERREVAITDFGGTVERYCTGVNCDIRALSEHSESTLKANCIRLGFNVPMNIGETKKLDQRVALINGAGYSLEQFTARSSISAWDLIDMKMPAVKQAIKAL